MATALIMGAGSGIGAALVKELAEDRRIDRVIATSRTRSLTRAVKMNCASGLLGSMAWMMCGATRSPI